MGSARLLTVISAGSRVELPCTASPTT